jgi:hypothetical protein
MDKTVVIKETQTHYGISDDAYVQCVTCKFMHVAYDCGVTLRCTEGHNPTLPACEFKVPTGLQVLA